MTNKEAKATLSVFQEDILNNLWLSMEQRKGLAEAINLAIKALEERPQGEFAKTLKDRIEESVCKYCPANNRCTLCEISRVFSIITLTAEEQKGGAE